jgi:hypothetical protein
LFDLDISAHIFYRYKNIRVIKYSNVSTIIIILDLALIISDNYFNNSNLVIVYFGEKSNFTFIDDFAFDNSKIKEINFLSSCKNLNHGIFSNLFTLGYIKFYETNIISTFCFINFFSLFSLYFYINHILSTNVLSLIIIEDVAIEVF